MKSKVEVILHDELGFHVEPILRATYDATKVLPTVELIIDGVPYRLKVEAMQPNFQKNAYSLVLTGFVED